MALLRKETHDAAHPSHPGRDFYALELDDADLAALTAGHPVQIRVGLPVARAFDDSTFTLFRRKAS